jgi:hypothetical protein
MIVVERAPRRGIGVIGRDVREPLVADELVVD